MDAACNLYVNLKRPALPKYQLATLSAHEAIPGHAWQGPISPNIMPKSLP